MSNVNALLSQRLKKGEQSSKMAEMAKQSAHGNLTTFAGMFSVSELTPTEKSFLEALLKAHAHDDSSFDADFLALVSLTAEVKAINNQAAILHGERIKKVHAILANYRDGAFSSWLMATYGNRQTPYNLMQYYAFYEAVPKPLRMQIEAMPRQAIYTLASREADLERKIEFVQSYKGQTKAELLAMIREAFPIDGRDQRSADMGEAAIHALEKICRALQRKGACVSKQQKLAIIRLARQLQELIDE